MNGQCHPHSLGFLEANLKPELGCRVVLGSDLRNPWLGNGRETRKEGGQERCATEQEQVMELACGEGYWGRGTGGGKASHIPGQPEVAGLGVGGKGISLHTAGSPTSKCSTMAWCSAFCRLSVQGPGNMAGALGSSWQVQA